MYLSPIYINNKKTKDLYKDRINHLFSFAHFKCLIYDILVVGEAFAIGGFLRDVINNQQSRDVDVVVSISQKELDDIIRSNIDSKYFKKNRLGGYKVFLSEDLELDIWTLDSSWSISKGLLKVAKSSSMKRGDEAYWLEKIASLAFFNFDSLTLSIRTLNGNFKRYNACAENGLLDLVKRSESFINSNPTHEANILRAFYLKDKYALVLSHDLRKYVFSHLKVLKWTRENSDDYLRSFEEKYFKYRGTMGGAGIEDLMSFLKY